MSSADLFNLLSGISFALSGVFVAAAIFVFFKFKIPQVIGYLTGKTAQRKIKEIEKRSTSTDETTSSKHMTAKIGSGAIDKKQKNRHNNKEDNSTTVLEGGNLTGEETTVLENSSLTGEETTVLEASGLTGEETTVLDQHNQGELHSGGHTEVLGSSAPENHREAGSKNGTFRVETDITITHTDESII